MLTTYKETVSPAALVELLLYDLEMCIRRRHDGYDEDEDIARICTLIECSFLDIVESVDIECNPGYNSRL